MACYWARSEQQQYDRSERDVLFSVFSEQSGQVRKWMLGNKGTFVLCKIPDMSYNRIHMAKK